MIFLFEFSHQKPQRKKRKKNGIPQSFSYCCSMRNDRLHQRWTLGDLCEIEMIKQRRFLDSVKPNNSTGFVFQFFPHFRFLFFTFSEGGVWKRRCRHDILYNM